MKCKQGGFLRDRLVYVRKEFNSFYVTSLVYTLKNTSILSMKYCYFDFKVLVF